MSTRKARITDSGPSAYQQLKALPEAERQWLWDRREKWPAKTIISQIAKEHGITGLTEQRLSDFWRWQEQQQELARMNEDAETFRDAFAKEHPESTMEEAHEATLAWLHLRGARASDEKLMKFVLTEIRKARVIENDRRKIAILETKAAEAVKAAEDPKLSAADKAERIREIFKR
jgi:hypothetical protein